MRHSIFFLIGIYCLPCSHQGDSSSIFLLVTTATGTEVMRTLRCHHNKTKESKDMRKSPQWGHSNKNPLEVPPEEKQGHKGKFPPVGTQTALKKIFCGASRRGARKPRTQREISPGGDIDSNKTQRNDPTLPQPMKTLLVGVGLYVFFSRLYNRLKYHGESSRPQK